MAVLEMKGATMKFGGLVAVNGLNLEVREGSIVALIGPNGAGKTTAFNMITGVYVPTSGEVTFRDKRLNRLRPDQITRLGIARTFQNIRLFKNLTVLDNILIAGHLRLQSGLFASVLKLPHPRREENDMRDQAHALLKQVNLTKYQDEIAGSLPYGSQRRLEIARALMTRPSLLLLDEPAAGMNPRETAEMATFIKHIREEIDLTILLVEHHMSLVMQVSDEIYVLEYGNLIAHGNPTQIRNDPTVIRAYLGEDDMDA